MTARVPPFSFLLLLFILLYSWLATPSKMTGRTPTAGEEVAE